MAYNFHYGTVDGVGALSPLWSDDGHFYDEDPYSDPSDPSPQETTPSFSEVEMWLIEVSSMMNNALADAGFEVPITVEAIVPMLNGKVNGIVKDIVDYSHSSGRFFTDQAIKQGDNIFSSIDSELVEWVQKNSKGLENQGANKTSAGRKSIDLRNL